MLAAWAGNPQLTNCVGTRQNYNTKAVVTELRPKITWLTRFTLTVADCSKVVETTMSQVKDHKADQETMQCNDRLCSDCAFHLSRHALDATSSQWLPAAGSLRIVDGTLRTVSAMLGTATAPHPAASHTGSRDAS